jgi:hypothetical protein
MKGIFAAKKRAVGVMLQLSPRGSCKEGFKRLGILTVMMFIVRNNIYQMNKTIHHIYTRQFGNLHVSSVRLPLIQNGVFYSLIIIHNNLPQNIQILITL